MSDSWKRRVVCLSLLIAIAGTAGALQQRPESPLAAKEFTALEMQIVGDVTRVSELPEGARTDALFALQNMGLDGQKGLLDRRGGRWGTLYPAIPMIPGSGVGNDLTWDSFGLAQPGDANAVADFTRERLGEFLRAQADSLRIDVDELDIRTGAHNGGALVQIYGARVVEGIPVRHAAFTAVVNHGNLSLLGTYAWGDVEVSLTPTLSPENAVAKLARFLSPLAVGGLRDAPSLTIVPTAVESATFAIGEGYEHRLAWVVNADVVDAPGSWEALVDAHTGALLSFQDLNHYGANRNINGGHYPVTYDGADPDGIMQDNYPMPFADLSSGGFTDSGGNFSAAGSVTTTLSGQFVRIVDNCTGSFSESSTGDIELGGTDGDVDCDTPTSGDNTAASRSGFYEVNRTMELARGQLPANVWLTNQLTSNMNINQFCNAFWSPAAGTINFYREGGGCRNTGQIGSVFVHEWGHGMDDNDVDGIIISSFNGGGEGVADLYAGLRLNTSCIGRGLFISGATCNGYGDPCTAASMCNGVRDIDWENRQSGQPHDLTWVQGNPNCFSSHCRGAVYAESVWDLFKRDLPAIYGLDNNTAMEVTSRLIHIASGNLGGWYSTGGTPNANCGGTFSYNQYLAVDDDNGNLNDGTPHMTAIADAFARHEIDCSPANGGPTVQDGGCANNPTVQPAVTVAANGTEADLSWGAVPNAVSYNVYRTDGVFACDFGKIFVGSTAGTTFNDTGLKEGHPYSYVVIPMGAGGPSCFGPASDCDTLGADNIFADGFESGDVTRWSTSTP